MSAGVKHASGEVIAFLDDDAIPRSDWLTRIIGHLCPADVGGVGGRDIVTDPDDLPRTTRAGVVTRWGKLIGNHHVVAGGIREVDVLKGANMAFKREALALPVHLLGQGAQANFEVATSLWARNRGWRLILDPAAEVMHLPGERFDADRRSRPSLMANLTVCLLAMRPDLTLRRLIYGLCVGDRETPGLARAALSLVQRDGVWQRLLPSMTGQLRGAVAVLLKREIEMETFLAEGISD
jgi:GT2 family glycosyltransferase